MTAPFRPTAEDLQVAMQHRRADPPIATTSVQEIVAAWAVTGMIAFGVLVVAPGGTRPTPSAEPMREAAAGLTGSGAALGKFESQADRAATLAGSDDGAVAGDRADEPPPPPASIARAAQQHIDVCHWITGVAPDAKRGS
jgi:hypothetical protein